MKQTRKKKHKGIQCPQCEEKLWSKYTHDFHYCGCGYCFVDGGEEYLRYGWGVKPPGDKENDGSITTKEWKWMSDQNKKIGKPEILMIDTKKEEEKRKMTQVAKMRKARGITREQIERLVLLTNLTGEPNEIFDHDIDFLTTTTAMIFLINLTDEFDILRRKKKPQKKEKKNA